METVTCSRAWERRHPAGERRPGNARTPARCRCPRRPAHHPRHPASLRDRPHARRAGEVAEETVTRRSHSASTPKRTASIPHAARLLGIALSVAPHEAAYVVMPPERSGVMADSRRVPAVVHAGGRREDRPQSEVRSLRAPGPRAGGQRAVLRYDARARADRAGPAPRHGLSEPRAYLGYTPVSITTLIGEKKGATPQRSMAEVPVEQVAEYAAEDADVTWQLVERLRPRLEELHQHRVFYDIEAPLLPVLVRHGARGRED